MNKKKYNGIQPTEQVRTFMQEILETKCDMVLDKWQISKTRHNLQLRNTFNVVLPYKDHTRSYKVEFFIDIAKKSLNPYQEYKISFPAKEGKYRVMDHRHDLKGLIKGHLNNF